MKEPENKIAKFTAASLSDWERAATEELQGSNPWKKLTNVQHGITIKPYYDHGSGIASPLQLPSSKDSFLGPRQWYNCPCVSVRDPAKANKECLQHLEQGAEGIFFELERPVDFNILLLSIDWPSCSLNFLVKDNAPAISTALANFLRNTKSPTHGAFFASGPLIADTHPHFRFIGQAIPDNASPIEALTQGITLLLERTGRKLKEITDHVAFSVDVGRDFFLETAKLRALRLAWREILKTKGIASEKPIYLHARSRAWTEAKYAPHANMLQSTTASMAAILGGCDSLTVDPEDPNQPVMNRVARNVSNILREESHLSLVADPVSGSYLIENLTAQIAEGTVSSLKNTGVI